MWQNLEPLKALLETTADGALAVVIISLVFAFLDRSYVKLSRALERLGDIIADQTKILSDLNTSHAVHAEVLRGLSNDIKSNNNNNSQTIRRGAK